jgi:hypothetical protein
MTFARRSAVGFLLSAAALGGCASSPSAAPLVSTSPALATVSGTVRVYGGPLLPNGKMAANGNPMAAVAPVVVKQDGRVVKRSSTNSEGRYSVDLPAGTYVISAGCSQPATVVLAAGERVARDLQCDVP